MIIKCAHCQTEFTRNKSRQKYCQPCRVEQPWRIKGVKACEFCGKEFTIRKLEARFCSLSCWYSISRKFKTKPCAVCGIVFKPIRDGQVCCSRGCSSKFGTYSRLKAKPKVCDVCKKQFDSKRRSRTCSWACAGFLRRVEPTYLNCRRCGNKIQHSRYRDRQFCSSECRKTPIGTISGKTNGGYVSVMTARGWQLHHRNVMESSIGRKLLRTETVHHKNGNRTDNRIENLELWNGNHGRGIRASDHHCAGCRCFEKVE